MNPHDLIAGLLDQLGEEEALKVLSDLTQRSEVVERPEEPSPATQTVTELPAPRADGRRMRVEVRRV